MQTLSSSEDRQPAPWPRRLPPAPADLIELVANAMVDFGPDGNCDGAEQLAAIVAIWSGHAPPALPPAPIYVTPDPELSTDDVRRIGNIASNDWSRGDDASHWRFRIDQRTRMLWPYFDADQQAEIAKRAYLISRAHY